MEINIHLTGNDLSNPNVRAAIIALGGASTEIAVTAPTLHIAEPSAEVEQASPQRKTGKSRKTEPTTEPDTPPAVDRETPAEPEKAKPDPSPTEEPDTPEETAAAQEAIASAPIPTIVDLRAKAQEVGTTVERKKAIKALLDEIGSKSISEVPEDKRTEFYEKLDELGQDE